MNYTPEETHMEPEHRPIFPYFSYYGPLRPDVFFSGSMWVSSGVFPCLKELSTSDRKELNMSQSSSVAVPPPNCLNRPADRASSWIFPPHGFSRLCPRKADFRSKEYHTCEANLLRNAWETTHASRCHAGAIQALPRQPSLSRLLWFRWWVRPIP